MDLCDNYCVLIVIYTESYNYDKVVDLYKNPRLSVLNNLY